MTETIKSFRDIIGAIEHSDIVAPQLGMPRKRFMGDGKHAARAAADPRGRAINSKYHDAPESVQKENQKHHAAWLAMSKAERIAHTAKLQGEAPAEPLDPWDAAERQRLEQSRAKLAEQMAKQREGHYDR